jgi:hypothetical protein
MCMYEEGDFYCLYIWIKLKFIIMKTIVSNFIDSSFEHVLHSYGLCLVSTYKYEIRNCLFYLISYLLDNHFLLTQTNMTHLNQCLLVNTKKPNNIVLKN